LRLLIDEMYPPAIARGLGRRGHDVVAITERADLRSAEDATVCAIAQQEQRAVVTENVADFVLLADAADQRGASHYGLVLVDPAKYPRGAHRTIGRLVRALDRLLGEHPTAESTGARHWL
jgi:NAD(P)-dependent dehydrogenase (short-subunit alcohol dehydrogenase family)